MTPKEQKIETIEPCEHCNEDMVMILELFDDDGRTGFLEHGRCKACGYVHNESGR